MVGRAVIVSRGIKDTVPKRERLHLEQIHFQGECGDNHAKNQSTSNNSNNQTEMPCIYL